MAGTKSGPNEFRRLTASELKTLAPMLNLETMPDPVAENLRASLSDYTHDRRRTADVPQPATSPSRFEALIRQAAAMQDLIAGMAPNELEMVAAVDPGLREVLKNLGGNLSRVAETSAQAIDRSRQGQTDRPAAAEDESPLHRLIHRLMVIFESQTGKEAGNSWDPVRDAYFGSFFDFTKAVLTIAAPGEKFTNRALGSQITKALASAKKLYGDFLARSHGRLPRIQIDPARR
jgi:hypothetical protein